MTSIFTAQHVFSVIFLLLAYFQFRFANNYRRKIMKNGKGQPTSYGPMMLWNNYIVCIGLLVVAIALLVGPLSH